MPVQVGVLSLLHTECSLRVIRISLLFQREDITVSSEVTILQCVNSILNDMVQNPGIHLAKFPTDVIGTKFYGQTLHNQVDIQTLHKQKR